MKYYREIHGQYRFLLDSASAGSAPAVSGCLGVSCPVGISRLAVPFILRTANKINIINN